MIGAFKRFIIITLSIILLSSIDISIAETTIDFEVPAPPASEFINTMPFRFAKKQIRASGYSSQKDSTEIVGYYIEFFKGERFKKLSDNNIHETDTRQMKFKRDDLMVWMILTPKEEGTDVAIAKYILPKGEPDLEEGGFSKDDSFMSLPQEDAEGEDLDIIPRPPDSVRWSSIDRGGLVLFTYATSISPEEARDFYKLNMPYQAWEIQSEIYVRDLIKKYKETTGAKTWSLGIKSPFVDSENLDRVMADSYVLEFKGRYGYAKITVAPNLVERELGSTVQILYSESQISSPLPAIGRSDYVR